MLCLMNASCSGIKEGLLSKSPGLDVVKMGGSFGGKCVEFPGLRCYRKTKIRSVGRDDKIKRSQSPVSQGRGLKIGGQTETVPMDGGLPVPGRQVQEQEQI